MAADPEQSTEICEGPKRCKTGKTGLVKSSSSFQVNFVSMLFLKHFQNSIIVFFWSQQKGRKLEQLNEKAFVRTKEYVWH